MSRVCVVLDGMAKILDEEKLKRLESGEKRSRQLYRLSINLCGKFGA